MPYTETHEITIGPITMPTGVRVDAEFSVGAGGKQVVTVVASTPTSKADTAALLQGVFALLMTAATAEGVGQPVFVSPAVPA